MSRAKAKLARLHDLQNYQSDIILTKKDCDMIAEALEKTFPFKEISNLYFYMKELGHIKYGRKVF